MSLGKKTYAGCGCVRNRLILVATLSFVASFAFVSVPVHDSQYRLSRGLPAAPKWTREVLYGESISRSANVNARPAITSIFNNVQGSRSGGFTRVSRKMSKRLRFRLPMSYRQRSSVASCFFAKDLSACALILVGRLKISSSDPYNAENVEAECDAAVLRCFERSGSSICSGRFTGVRPLCKFCLDGFIDGDSLLTSNASDEYSLMTQACTRSCKGSSSGFSCSSTTWVRYTFQRNQ